MVKFTDPSFQDLFFVIDDSCIYTVDKKNFNEFIEALESSNQDELSKYKFDLVDLDPDENYLHCIFDKLHTPYIRLLFHE